VEEEGASELRRRKGQATKQKRKGKRNGNRKKVGNEERKLTRIVGTGGQEETAKV
jgi:hypothetical protein